MYSEILAEQIQINQTGMYLLLGWSVVNIVAGTVATFYYKKNPVLKHFFQMNALWNIVNLVIAAIGLHQLSLLDPSTVKLQELLYKVFTFEKLLLFNAGLDIAYIAIGSFLVERGANHKSTLLKGFGKALWLQGGFLFLFDILYYFINTGINQRYSTFILF